MRSAKSELFLLLEAIITGGSYIDANDIEYEFDGIADIKHFAFWNNSINTGQHDNYPLPAVFFQLTNTNVIRNDNKIAETYSRISTKENCEFILHVIDNKMESDNKNENYLNILDIAQTVIETLTNISVANIRNILHISDEFDSDSQFIIDFPITFKCTLSNIGVSTLTDANDIDVNPSAPVVFSIDIEKYE